VKQNAAGNQRAPRDREPLAANELEREVWPVTGTKLRTMPNIDMRWDAWKELHPDTKERVLGIPDGAGGVAA
jgi:hypothetical protein